MRLALFLILLISGCGGYTEQEDYGWVEKPRRAVMERIRSDGRIDTAWVREYFYSGEQLDSLIETRLTSRSVYSQFDDRKDLHKLFTSEAILYANTMHGYKKREDGEWILSVVTIDSTYNDQLASSILWRVDKSGKRYVHRRKVRTFDSTGLITSAFTIAKDSQVTGTRYEYQRDRSGRLLRSIQLAINSGTKVNVMTATDTERVTRYHYDDTGQLISMKRTGRVADHPFTTTYSEVELLDSVDWSTLSSIVHPHVIADLGKMLHSGVIESIEGGKVSRMRFLVEVDERYRLSRLKTDSSERTAAYFEDNTLRERISRDSSGLSWHQRIDRKHDTKNRIVTQESMRLMGQSNKWKLIGRIRFEY